MSIPNSQPPLLIRAGFVYTADGANGIHPEGSVLAMDGQIFAVGPASEVEAICRLLPTDLASQLRTIDARGSMVLPGFVNPHWHDMFAARASFGGIARKPDDRADRPGFLARGGDMPLISTLFDRFAGMVGDLTADEADAIARYSVWSQVRCGTTTLGDVGSLNQPAALARAAASFGINAAISTWASDVVCETGRTARRTRDTDTLLVELEDLFTSLDAQPSRRVRARASAVYLTNASDDLLAGLSAIVAAHDTTFATHVGAQRHETDFVRANFGRTPVERLADFGLLSDRLMAVHCAFLDQTDAERVIDSRVHVNHSPAKYGSSGESTISETRWIPGLVQRGHPVSLSTDGTVYPLGAMPENMRAAWQMHNETFADQTVLPPSGVLAMATRIAAAGLGWDSWLGSIEVGKQADLVLVPTTDWRYMFNPRPLEGFLAIGGSGDVATVIAAGRVLIEDGEVLAVDADTLADEYAAALRSFSARQPGADLALLDAMVAQRRQVRRRSRLSDSSSQAYPSINYEEHVS